MRGVKPDIIPPFRIPSSAESSSLVGTKAKSVVRFSWKPFSHIWRWPALRATASSTIASVAPLKSALLKTIMPQPATMVSSVSSVRRRFRQMLRQASDAMVEKSFTVPYRFVRFCRENTLEGMLALNVMLFVSITV